MPASLLVSDWAARRSINLSLRPVRPSVSAESRGRVGEIDHLCTKFRE